jgi:TRAP-type uncharacterized transport system substrate-binding protein
MAFCGMFAAAPVYADPGHQAKPAAPREGREAILRHNMRDEINAGLVGIVSEGTDYTVDLALSLAGEQNRLRVLPIAGAGASQNAKDVMFARGIDFGVLQTDVLDEIKRTPPFPGVEKYLQYVTKFYDQQLHVLVGADVQSIEDLRGKKVNFGLRDGGTFTTAAAVFKTLGIEPDVTALPYPLALDKLRRGEISALVYVATKPSRLFQDIRPEEHLHFLPITGDLPPIYTADTITSDDYPELVSRNTPVMTIGVGTVLVAYNWPAKSERHQRVSRFVQAFFANLKEIKGRRPKWRDFDVSASVAGWTRFPAAEEWLKKAGLTLEPDKRAANLDPKQRNDLFRDFAEYQKTHEPALFRDFAEYQKTHEPALFREFAEYQRTHEPMMMVAYHGTGGDH